MKEQIKLIILALLDDDIESLQKIKVNWDKLSHVSHAIVVECFDELRSKSDRNAEMLSGTYNISTIAARFASEKTLRYLWGKGVRRFDILCLLRRDPNNFLELLKRNPNWFKMEYFLNYFNYSITITADEKIALIVGALFCDESPDGTKRGFRILDNLLLEKGKDLANVDWDRVCNLILASSNRVCDAVYLYFHHSRRTLEENSYKTKINLPLDKFEKLYEAINKQYANGKYKPLKLGEETFPKSENAQMRAEIVIFEAAASGWEESFRDLIAQIKSPNIQQDGIPLLHYVAAKGGSEMLSLMLRTTVDINSTSNFKLPNKESCRATALQWVCGMMFPHLTNSRIVDKTNKTISHPVMSRINDFSQMLLNRGAHKDFFSMCALGDETGVRSALDINPDLLNQPGPDGQLPLAWAARTGQNTIVSLLLSRVGAEKIEAYVNASDFNGNTAMDEALAHQGNSDTIRLLSNANAKMKTDKLYHSNMNLEQVENLFRASDNPSASLSHRDANYLCEFEVPGLELIIKYGVDLGAAERSLLKTENNFTPYVIELCDQTQAIDKHEALLRLYIKAGININLTIPDHLGAAPYLKDSTPLVLLHFQLKVVQNELDSRPEKKEFLTERNYLLQLMAILFVHGSTVEPVNPKHQNPILSLEGTCLIEFLRYVHCELTEHNGTQSVTIPPDRNDILQSKIVQGMQLLKGRMPTSIFHSNSVAIITQLQDIVEQARARIAQPAPYEFSQN